MATWTNTILYQVEWTVKLQERLNAPQNWKDVCRVEYTDTRTITNPYLTDFTVQTTARNSSYTHQNVTITTDATTISDIAILPIAIDRADLAQQTYLRQMEMAEIQAVQLGEKLESAMLAEYTNMTDFGDTGGGVLGLAATQITVSATNIDDIIRGLRREIYKANGANLLARNGGFIVWRPADAEYLEQFMQANGFVLADKSLKEGFVAGVDFMGFTHYVSNSHTANHLIAGVKKALHLGICKSTYGQVVVDEEPATADGAVSAVAVISRVDYKYKVWNKMLPILFDVNVA